MRLILMAFWSLFSLTLLGQNSLSIMYYNLLNYPGTTAGRADTLRKIVQYSQPDLFVVNELTSEEGAEMILENSLNAWGNLEYSRAAFTDGYDSDNMLFFKHQKLALYSQYEIETELRLINEYVLYTLPILNDTVFLTVYSAHLKASEGSSEENQRWEEVKAFKEHLLGKHDNRNIFFGGDLNIYNGREKAYTELLSADGMALFDPLFMPGEWHNNQNYAAIHTQSTRSTQFGGGASGGMDDRFDMIFVSEDVLNGSNRIQYIRDSYEAFGQDGFRFNLSMLDPAHQSLPDSLVSALYYMSDHLPVMMRFDVLETASAIAESLRPTSFIVEYYVYSGQLHLASTEKAINFKIIDLMGKEVFQSKIDMGNQSINLPSYLNGGIYLFYFQEQNSQKMYLKKTVLL